MRMCPFQLKKKHVTDFWCSTYMCLFKTPISATSSQCTGRFACLQSAPRLSCVAVNLVLATFIPLCLQLSREHCTWRHNLQFPRNLGRPRCRGENMEGEGKKREKKELGVFPAAPGLTQHSVCREREI